MLVLSSSIGDRDMLAADSTEQVRRRVVTVANLKLVGAVLIQCYGFHAIFRIVKIFGRIPPLFRLLALGTRHQSHRLIRLGAVVLVLDDRDGAQGSSIRQVRGRPRRRGT